jgi:natural resistance-associated macrophage protein
LLTQYYYYYYFIVIVIVIVIVTHDTYTSFSLHIKIVRVAWILSMVIMGVNIYFFCTSFLSWLVHSELPRVLNAIISTLVFPFMAAYISALIYLVFKKVSIPAMPFPSMAVSSETEVADAQRQDDKVDDVTLH